MLNTQSVSRKYFMTENKTNASKKAKHMYDFESVLQRESTQDKKQVQESAMENVNALEDEGWDCKVKKQEISDKKISDKEISDKENCEIKESMTTSSENKTDEKELSEQDLLQGDTLTQELPKEIVQIAQTLLMNVMQLISDFTGKSVEEIQGMMDTFGMQMQEIMDSAKLNQFVANLMGKHDVMQLLTDAEFSGMMKELVVAVNVEKQEFLDMFQMKPEQIRGLLDALQSEDGLNDVKQVMSETVADMKISSEQDVLGKQNSILIEEQDSQKEIQKSVQNQVMKEEWKEIQDVTTNPTKNTESDSHADQNADFTGEMLNKSNRNIMMSAKAEQSDAEDTVLNQDFSIGMTGMMEHLQSAIEEVLPETNREIVANRIMSQITDSIRTQATPDMKSLEVQLEPENLGKVTVSIMSKAGHVTAEIAAQTQMAKEAIEGQLAILKENLQQQGVKVESIEVTIASHSFEENLEKGNESHAGQQNEQRHRRMLGKDIVEGMNGLDSEAENLEEKVIEDLGANISYLA